MMVIERTWQILCIILQASLLGNTIKIIINSQAESCKYDEQMNHSMVCKELDHAINFAASYQNISNESLFNTIQISIPRGVHYVTNQSNFGVANVHFIGLEADVTIVCYYYADNSTYDSNMIHTWFFNRSENIVMQNIHFKNCGLPFRFFAVQEVNIYNCMFTNFSEAVLDIYNCQNVTLHHISLQNNSGNGRLLEPLRGNSGGVAIGYSNMPIEYTNPTLIISNSSFTGNQALGFLTPERAIMGQVFMGRGGGVALYMNESYQELRIKISDCIFENNMARLFGGGLFMLTTSYDTLQHIVQIDRSQFIGNVGLSGGAGVLLAFLSSGNLSRPHSFIFSDCLFERNQGESGGGIYIFVDDNGNLARLDRCIFRHNVGFGTQEDLGAAIALSFLIRFAQRVTSTQHEIINCSFVRNSSPNGILSLGYAPMRLSGSNTFIGNQGASLRIIGSLVDIEGKVEFRNNTASEEGALTLLSFGQIRLTRGTHLLFHGNIGSLGSSIVVNTPASLRSFDDLLFNPRCFILYENRTTPPTEWRDVLVSFVRNEAIVSSAVYLFQSGLACSWFKSTPPFFNSTFVPDWPIWSYSDNLNSGFIESTLQSLSFGTTAEQFSSNSSDISVWPGQRVQVSLVGFDQFNHHTSASAQFTFQPNTAVYQNISSESVRFDPQIIVLTDSQTSNGLLQESFPFSYRIKSPDLLSSVTLPLGQVVTEEAFNPHPISSDNFTLFPLPCPGGYSLVELPGTDTMMCMCVDIREEIVFCEDDQDTVVLKYGTWAMYNPTDVSGANLFFHSCPAGYCHCSFSRALERNTSAEKMCVYKYKHSNPDEQCICEREGILCGKCRNDAGVSVLLNRCVTCSDGFLALIPLLIVIIVVVFIAIILIDKPLPEWSIPFLFYIQNAPYATTFFPETFAYAGKYFHYLSSATNFYFIYDFCLSNNLSATISYLLRYLPALTASLVYFIVWFVRRKALKKKNLHNNGCWWCILLLYSSVAYTSMSSLNCPSIPEKSTNKIHWFLSGETECFTGIHILLALIAILMLGVCVFFIFFVPLLPVVKIPHFKNYMEPFSVHYKDGMSYWSGIELARRFLFLLALIPFPRNTVYAIIVLVFSTSLYTYNFPYKSKAANILEVMLQLNFLALLLLESMQLVKDELFLFNKDTIDGICNNDFSNISNIVILLIPLYYAPLALFLILAFVFTVIHIQRYRARLKQDAVYDHETEMDYVSVNNHYTTQILDIDYSQGIIPL